MDGLTESELLWIDSYLRPRIVERRLADAEWISEVKDICTFDPDELVGISRDQKTEGEWWFVSTNAKPPFQWQIAKTGNWEEHQESVKMKMDNGEIAWKIPVVFCKYGSPKSIETEWRMDQFYLPRLAPLIFLCRLWKSEFTPETNGGMNGSQQDQIEGDLCSEASGGLNGELDEGADSSPSSTSSAVDDNSDVPQKTKKEVKEEAAAEEPVHTACLDSNS